MVPEVVVCDRCGRTVVVISFHHVEVDAEKDSLGRWISVRIDCPHCGTRTQIARLETAKS